MFIAFHGVSVAGVLREFCTFRESIFDENAVCSVFDPPRDSGESLPRYILTPLFKCPLCTLRQYSLYSQIDCVLNIYCSIILGALLLLN